MLRVNVGISRKLSKDFNSTGFQLNLEGEICTSLDEPEAVIERIREFYDLAEEALHDQIRRHDEVEDLARREDDGPTRGNRWPIDPPAPTSPTNGSRRPRESLPTNGEARPGGVPATPKQIEYLSTLARRQGLTPTQLDARMTTAIGRSTSLDDLTKLEAGQVIETLVGPRQKSDRSN